METIKDSLGRQWRISVTSPSIERVRADTGADLLEFGMDGPGDKVEEGIFFRLRADSILLSKILFSLCAREAEKLGVGWDDFGDGFDGDALNAGMVAVQTEIVNFIREPKTREAMRSLIGDLTVMMDRGVERIVAKMSDPRIQEANENELKKLDDSLDDLLGNLVEQSREPLPSGS